MRNIWRRAVVVVVTLCAAGAVIAADPPKALGVSSKEAKDEVLTGLETGTAWSYSAKNAFKAASPAQRESLTKGLLEWAKAWVESADFKTSYESRRNAAKPEAPDMSGSAADDVKQQHEEQMKGVNEMEAGIKNMPADQRKEMEEVVKSTRQQYEEMWKDPEFKKMELQGAQQQRDEKVRQYKENLANWEKRFPADPKTLLVKRLKEFLAESGTVDFDAKLVEKNGLKRFANPEYEAKPSQWKAYYRAGRETIAVARAFASAWLAELGAK